jgi:hypothetical protein
MEPITLIMGALAAAGKTIGEQAIKDGYAGLKALIARKFGAGNPKLGERIEDYVQDPETYAKPAEKALREAGADQDKEVVEGAAELLKQAESVKPGVSGGLVGQLTATHSNVAVVGGDVHGGLTFGAATRREN